MTNFDDRMQNSFEVNFKNVDYVVNMQVEAPSPQAQQQLCLEIEEKLTAERWKGVFDATYVEDLTRKTGNFKQFIIFVNMLETALIKNSDSVSLDLFTYSDLEQLRNKKAANASLLTKSSSSLTSLNTNNNKRYLILTYNVEFDRIHYPLQLNYQGKPDPVVLQDTIRKLKNELKLYRGQSSIDAKRNEIIKLQRDYERVVKEKETLELEIGDYKSRLKESMLNTSETMQKEIKSLKQMIKNIEEDSLKEKSSYQKQLHKKLKENNQLIEEINELRSSERTLKHELKCLQNELALYRRNRVFTGSTGNVDSTARRTRSRESSRENSLTRNGKYSHSSRNGNGSGNNSLLSSHHKRDRSLSRESSLTRPQRVSSAGSTTRGANSARSLSRDREREIALAAAVASGLKSTRSRSNSYERSSRNGQIPRSNRTKTPSPSNSVGSNGSRSRRFNPTDYVKDKSRKLEEIELKKQRQIRTKMNLNDNNKLVFNSKNSNMRTRTPSVSSINSGVESDNDSISSFDHHKKHRKRNGLPNNDILNKLTNSTPNNTIANKKQTAYSSKHKHFDNDTTTDTTLNDETDYSFYSREKEIKEIDARLKSLQMFMKNNMP